MSKQDDLTIGEARKLSSLFCDKPKSCPETSSLQIVVLDKGFVFVGKVEFEDNFILIHDAKCVRRWGTKAGLGELALKGPLEETILDHTGELRAPMSAVIFQISCNTSAWK